MSVINKILKKIGYPVLEIGSADDVRHSRIPQQQQKNFIFDDLINAPEKVQNKIANHFTHGRQYKISPIYLSQSYYDVPQKIRLNCIHMLLYPPTNKII